MKRSRHQARILALQGLYQLDIQQAPPDADVPELIAPLLAEASLPTEAADYARRLTAGAWTHRQRYDQMIACVSDHWEVGRMAVVDRNILRLALHEIIEQPEVPVRVVIDEAIEIGREFGETQTPQFINGVLDAIWKQHPACQAARSRPEAPTTWPTQNTEDRDGIV